jgi:hypothetical protein
MDGEDNRLEQRVDEMLECFNTDPRFNALLTAISAPLRENKREMKAQLRDEYHFPREIVNSYRKVGILVERDGIVEQFCRGIALEELSTGEFNTREEFYPKTTQWVRSNPVAFVSIPCRY